MRPEPLLRRPRAALLGRRYVECDTWFECCTLDRSLSLFLFWMPRAYPKEAPWQGWKSFRLFFEDSLPSLWRQLRVKDLFCL